MFVPDYALTVNDEGFGHAVHPEFDTNQPIRIHKRLHIRIPAILNQPAGGIVILVLVIQAVDRYDIFSGQFHHHWMLELASDAPRCPDIKDPYFAK